MAKLQKFQGKTLKCEGGKALSGEDADHTLVWPGVGGEEVGKISTVIRKKSKLELSSNESETSSYLP